MGDEGYSLHQELVSQTNDQMDSVSSDNGKKSTRRSDIRFDVSISAFVHSVLRTASIECDQIQPDVQNLTKTEDDNDRVAPVTKSGEGALSMPLTGGIGALAAQAALKKIQDKQPNNNNKNPAPGGIAALAAQAAQEKSKEKLDVQHYCLRK